MCHMEDAVAELHGFSEGPRKVFEPRVVSEIVRPAERVTRGLLDAYQDEAWRTAANPTNSQLQLASFALGVTGEAGEVADLIKKHIGHGHPMDKDKLCKELGDVLWYVATLAKLNGLKLSEVAEANVLKLRKRYPDGFSSERSINREPDATALRLPEDGSPQVACPAGEYPNFK